MKRNKSNNYEQYKKNQVVRADRKWGSKIFSEHNFVSGMNSLVEKPSVIGCMGIRNGNVTEYAAFKEVFPSAEVYGVDIHPKVEDVGDNCFAYDFNHLPKSWADKFDLLYSNSIDHAFNVKQTIKEWIRVTKPGGYLFLSFSTADIGWADTYSFEVSDIKELFTEVEIIKVWSVHDAGFNGLFRKAEIE